MAVRQSGVKTAPKAASAKPDVKVFVSYSHKDEAARAKLETHLAALKRDGVTTWFDGDLNAGDALDTNIAHELKAAHIFVALLSPDYLASTYCWKKEYSRAMTRRAKGLVRVIAVVVRPCDWKATRAAGFKLLPKDARPVTAWKPADKAYSDITSGIRDVVGVVRKELLAAAAAQARKAALRKVVAKLKSAAKPKAAKIKLHAPTKPARGSGRPRKTGPPKR